MNLDLVIPCDLAIIIFSPQMCLDQILDPQMVVSNYCFCLKVCVTKIDRDRTKSCYHGQMVHCCV